MRSLTSACVGFLATIGFATAAVADDWTVCNTVSGQAAIDACSRIAERTATPQDQRALAFNQRGVANQSLGRSEAAIESYTQAIGLNRDFALAYNNRGYSFAVKMQFDSALADYNAAIRLKPNFPLALSNRGMSLATKGVHDRAIRDFDRAIQLDPRNALAFNNRGLSYSALGNYDRGISDFDRAIALQPNFGRFYSNRGHSYFAQGDRIRARADYDTAIRLGPNDAIAYHNRGNLHYSDGNQESAIADFDEAIRLNPNFATPYAARGLSHARIGEHDRAIADYDKAIALNPNFTGAFYRRGLSYVAKGNRERAIADYARAESIAIAANDAFSRNEQLLAKNDLQALLNSPAPTPANPAVPSQPLKRFALIIANSKYTAIKPLTNPPLDATGIAQVLRGLGFDVTIRQDLGREQFVSELRKFEARLRKDAPDWALVYFSGHGTETADGAFMLPTDVLIENEGEYTSDLNIVEDSVSVQNVLKRIQAAKLLRLVIYDACRDNPALSAFNRVLQQSKQATEGANRATGLGWGRDGVIFASSPGTFALDGSPGEMSPFARSIISLMLRPGLDLNEMVNELGKEVEGATKAMRVVPQRPDWKGFPLAGNNYFTPPSSVEEAKK